MSIRSLAARAALVTAVAVAAAAPTPARAHTTIPIVGNQFVAPGGELNGYGVVGNVTVDDGPATDGTVAWFNGDPHVHTLHVSGPRHAVVTIAPGASGGVSKLPKGSYVVTDPAFPTMVGRFRVTGTH